MKREPRKAWVILATAVAVMLIGTLMFESSLLGLLGFAIIVVTTAEFWLGAKYEIDAVGARRKVGISVTEMTWESVKRIVASEEWVLLSPLEADTKLGPFRGVRLLFEAAKRDQVITALRTHGGEHVRGLV